MTPDCFDSSLIRNLQTPGENSCRVLLFHIVF
jgi:hypothetical protein